MMVLRLLFFCKLIVFYMSVKICYRSTLVIFFNFFWVKTHCESLPLSVSVEMIYTCADLKIHCVCNVSSYAIFIAV